MALKLGLNLGYWGIGPAGEDAVEVVQAAERAGFESVWAAESYGSDVVSVLAWLAPQTKTINLGAAIMQVPARPPAAAAMAGATIDKLSGGRFLFGFGPSGPQVSEGWYGVPYAKPWGRTREYIEVVREIVAREGQARTRRRALQAAAARRRGQAAEAQLPPRAHPDPRLRRRDRPQIGRDGGGDLRRLDPDLLQRRRLRADLGRAPGGGVRQGRQAALRPRGLTLLQVAIDGDLEAAKNVVKAGLVLYFGGMGSRKTNFYVDLAHRFGFGDVADEVQRRFQEGDRGGAFEAMPDEIVEATSLVGSEAEVAERIERFRGAGIDRLIVSPVHVDRGEQLHTIERLAGLAGRAGARGPYASSITGTSGVEAPV